MAARSSARCRLMSISAGFTGAGAQVAVIEGEGGYADGGEADREIGQGRASDTADAMG